MMIKKPLAMLTFGIMLTFLFVFTVAPSAAISKIAQADTGAVDLINQKPTFVQAKVSLAENVSYEEAGIHFKKYANVIDAKRIGIEVKQQATCWPRGSP